MFSAVNPLHIIRLAYLNILGEKPANMINPSSGILIPYMSTPRLRQTTNYNMHYNTSQPDIQNTNNKHHHNRFH